MCGRFYFDVIGEEFGDMGNFGEFNVCYFCDFMCNWCARVMASAVLIVRKPLYNLDGKEPLHG